MVVVVGRKETVSVQEQELTLSGHFVRGRRGSPSFHVGQLARLTANIYGAPVARQLELKRERGGLGLSLPKLWRAGGGGMTRHPVKWAVHFGSGAHAGGRACGLCEAPSPEGIRRG